MYSGPSYRQVRWEVVGSAGNLHRWMPTHTTVIGAEPGKGKLDWSTRSPVVRFHTVRFGRSLAGVFLRVANSGGHCQGTQGMLAEAVVDEGDQGPMRGGLGVPRYVAVQRGSVISFPTWKVSCTDRPGSVTN
jgi:hypothetical protein